MLDTLLNVLSTGARIKTGERYLNECFGVTWYHDVDVDDLDMGDCQWCVIGQLTGDHWDNLMQGTADYESPYRWVNAQGSDFPPALDDIGAPSLLGFDQDSKDAEYNYAVLDAGWRALIDERWLAVMA